jgi:hypothetical protein
LDNVHGSLEASLDSFISGQSTTLSWAHATCDLKARYCVWRMALNNSTGQVTNCRFSARTGLSGILWWRIGLYNRSLASVTVAV